MMAEQLVSLLLPINALLSHADYTPRTQASSVLVVLFRNMWFLCTLFKLRAQDEKKASATEWRRPALAQIAVATPPLIDDLGRRARYLRQRCRFQPVHSLRLCEFGKMNLPCAQMPFLTHSQAIAKHFNILNRLLPTHHHQIRSLSSGLITFLLAMHDVESMRSAAG